MAVILWCGVDAPAWGKGSVRHYYIAAEYVSWDYAPSGRDLISGRRIPSPWPKLTWRKTRYIEYTDDTFSVRKPQPEWLGILGPIIRAEVGDTVVVDFLNRTNEVHSIHPHGLHYDKANEGAAYVPATAGGRVVPGSRFTYHWFADEASGPGPSDPSSVVWWYHPHSDEGLETNAGLLGPIIVTAAGKAKSDGAPSDVDQEFVALFMIFDEAGGKDEGLFHTINGFIFGNLSGFVMREGDRVRWHLLAIGNEQDLHTPHWHGQTVVHHQSHVDLVELLPGTMTTVDMLANNPGTWLLHCHVEDHMEAGMMAVYTIAARSPRSCPASFSSGSFWQGLGAPPSTYGEPKLEVKNRSPKAVRKLVLHAGYFVRTAQNLSPVPYEWTWTGAIPPGGSSSVELTQASERSHLRAYYSGDVIGVLIYPEKIEYADGSTWAAETQGECFGAIWRDNPHPSLTVLPPFQPAIEEEAEEEE